jgi:hypothetical protein
VASRLQIYCIESYAALADLLFKLRCAVASQISDVDNLRSRDIERERCDEGDLRRESP